VSKPPSKDGATSKKRRHSSSAHNAQDSGTPCKRGRGEGDGPEPSPEPISEKDIDSLVQKLDDQLYHKVSVSRLSLSSSEEAKSESSSSSDSPSDEPFMYPNRQGKGAGADKRPPKGAPSDTPKRDPLVGPLVATSIPDTHVKNTLLFKKCLREGVKVKKVVRTQRGMVPDRRSLVKAAPEFCRRGAQRSQLSPNGRKAREREFMGSSHPSSPGHRVTRMSRQKQAP